MISSCLCDLFLKILNISSDQISSGQLNFRTVYIQQFTRFGARNYVLDTRVIMTDS